MDPLSFFPLFQEHIMAVEAVLVRHRGAREVSRAELAHIGCPPAEGWWRPVAHIEVLTSAETALQSAGYGIDRMNLALSGNNARFL